MVKNVLVNASLSILSVLAKLTPYYGIMIVMILIALVAFNFKNIKRYIHKRKEEIYANFVRMD